jgi:hypothetical protein
MDSGTRTRVATVLALLLVLGTAGSALAQAGPPPPQTVPSIGLRTPQALPPASVPSIGARTPDPTTAPFVPGRPPGTSPTIGVRTPDPTTAFPAAVPSIGERTPDPTTAPIGTSR